jgi:hypothetical protein
MSLTKSLAAGAAALACVTVLASEAEADASRQLRVESFKPGTKAVHGQVGHAGQGRPGDPPCNFVSTRGREFPRFSRTFYATSVSQLPPVIQAQPEAANGAFRPAPAAVVARDRAVIAAMAHLTGGKIHSTVTSDPTQATTFVFGSTANLGPDVLAISRLAFFTDTPSKAAFAWAAFSLADIAADVDVTAHEVYGHARAGLEDVPIDAYYDIPGVAVGDTAGLSAMFSARPLQLQKDDVHHVTTTLDACDVQVINNGRYY